MSDTSYFPYYYSEFVKITATNGYSYILKSRSMSQDALSLVARKDGCDMVMWDWMWRTGNIRSIVRLLTDQITEDGFLIK